MSLTVAVLSASSATPSPTGWTLVVTLAVGAVTGLVAAVATIYVSRRTNSGKISTTEAGTLWQASEQIRKELRDETVSLRVQLGEVRAKQEKQEADNLECERRAMALQQRVGALEAAMGIHGPEVRPVKKTTPRRGR